VCLEADPTDIAKEYKTDPTPENKKKMATNRNSSNELNELTKAVCNSLRL
jgi:hypothetical protein